MLDRKIGILDFSRSENKSGSRNVSIDLVSRSKLEPYGTSIPLIASFHNKISVY
jgi:hypothetical protein